MPRRIDLPDVSLPPRLSIPEPPRQRARTRRLTTKAQVRRTIKLILKRYADAQGEMWEIGRALSTLDKPEVLTEFGAASFRAFVEEHVMPYSTARRHIIVATNYTKPVAKQLGMMKAIHLLEYVQVAGVRRSAQKLALRDARLRPSNLSVSQHSALSLKKLISTVRMTQGRQEMPKASRAQKRVARSMKSEFAAHFGIDAKVSVDPKRRVIHFEVGFDDVDGLEGE